MTLIIKKEYINLRIILSFVAIAFLALFPLINATKAGAAAITNRKVTLSSSAADASNVTYTLTSDALPTSGTVVKSLEIEFCTSLTGACTTPTSFSSASSTLASQPSGLGDGSGWTVNTATTGSLRVSNTTNAATPSGSVSVVWNGVHNPQTANQTFYGVITTYSDDAWTTAVDSGSVALSTSAQIQVSLDVSEILTFCTGTSMTGENCGTVSGTTVDLGDGSTTQTASGTSVMAASTNGASGYTITVAGSTLTSGANTITALSSGGTSQVGVSQFGVNLVSNTTPSVGANVTGSGSGSAETNYDTSNTFRLGTGEIVASASEPTNANKFTVSYIANIDGVTPPGSYTTTLTYTATANF